MNGYEIAADACRRAAERGFYTKEQAAKKCKALDFLATCDDEDINNLYDSSAFNDITKAYIAKVAYDLAGEGTINEDQESAIKWRLNSLFDEMSASEVLSKFYI